MRKVIYREVGNILITDEPNQADFDHAADDKNCDMLFLIMGDEKCKKFLKLDREIHNPHYVKPSDVYGIQSAEYYEFVASEIHSKVFGIDMRASSWVSMYQVPDPFLEDFLVKIEVQMDYISPWSPPKNANREKNDDTVFVELPGWSA